MKPSRRFNLRIDYWYGLGTARRVACRLVLAGPAGTGDVATIKDRLEDGIWFIPGQVGLPDLCCAFDESARGWSETRDQPWHALEQVSLTTKPATPGLPLATPEVVQAFEGACWNDDYRVDPKPIFAPVAEGDLQTGR